MIYKAEFENENFEILQFNDDNNALNCAFEYEKEHGTLFNLYEVNEDYEEIRTIF